MVRSGYKTLDIPNRIKSTVKTLYPCGLYGSCVPRCGWWNEL